jgi:hypothetical protein
VRPPRWWLSNRSAADPKTRFAKVAEHYAPLLNSASTAAQHHQVLMDLTVDAWVAGALAAGKLAPAIADALTDDQTLGAPDDWEPGWAETADLPDELPDELQSLLDGTENASMPDDLDAAEAQAETCAAYACGDGADAAYAAGGIDKFDSVPDASACQTCLDAADSGPYDVGDDGPPWHNGCGCESVPVTTSEGNE